MSVLNKVNTVKWSEYVSIVRRDIRCQEPDILAGIFSTFTHSWLATGSKLYVINNSDGTIQSSWEFGEGASEFFEISCAIELRLEGCFIPLLIVGVSSENSHKICFYNPNTHKILRTLKVDYPVRVLCLIEDGLSEVNPLNQALANTQGLLAAGSADGSILLIDLCRSILLKGLNADFRYISDEEHPADLLLVELNSLAPSTINKQLEECYIQLQSLAVLIPGDEDDGITAFTYSFESAVLFAGTSTGSFVLWNLSNLKCLFHSQPNGPAIVSLALLEPCDDPRHNLFLWACYENHPQALMFCITFASKAFVQDYGVYYRGFESASLVFRLTLGREENLPIRRPVNVQSVIKSIAKNRAKSFNISDGDSTQLRLFVTTYEVMEKWSGDGGPGGRAVVFDLNQWYKEQMPEEGWSACTERVELGGGPLYHACLCPRSLSIYQCVRPLEQHFHPTSLDFKIWCIEEEGLRCVEKLGLQSQWLRNISVVGPSVLLNPSNVFHGAITAGLLPAFSEPPDPDAISLEEERKYVLTVCLENWGTSVVENCAREWSTGGHPVAGCTLNFIIDWLWELYSLYKSQAHIISIPLFDQSGLKFDLSERRSLQHCKSLLTTVQNLYKDIVKKYSAYILSDGIDQKMSAMSLVQFYFDCCIKLVSVNLLPEPNDAGKPVDSIGYKYDEVNTSVCTKRKEGPFLGDSLLDEGNALKWWEEEGGTGRYPPPSVQSVLRYTLHPAVSSSSKLSLILYLYMDIIHSHPPTLSDQKSLEKVKDFQYLFRIPDVQFNIVTGFWYLDNRFFEEGASQLLNRKVLPADLTDDQHRNVLRLLSLQGEDKLGLQYLRRKAPHLHLLNDLRMELDLLLNNKLINEAFMFQRKHIDHRKDLLIQFFQGCIKKKLLGHVFGLNLDPMEETFLMKFLNSSELNNKEDLQVLFLLSRAKYNEALSLNDRLKKQVPRGKAGPSTRDMIVKGITGGMSSISRDFHLAMRQYKPPPPGTQLKPLSAFIKVQNGPDGPTCQTDKRLLLSAAAMCTRQLSDFVTTAGGKRKRSSWDLEEELMEIGEEREPPKKRFAREGGKYAPASTGLPWLGTPLKSSQSRGTDGRMREVMELVGTPLVKKKGKRISPLSRPSSILKGKTPDRSNINMTEDHGDTPSRKMLRFALPDSDRVTGRKPLRGDILGTERPDSAMETTKEVEVEEVSRTPRNIDSVMESIRERLRSSKNKLFDDGSVDWKNIAESNQPKTLFTPGTGKAVSKSSQQSRRIPRQSKALGSGAQGWVPPADTTIDISISEDEKKYLASPSRDAEPSPDTQAVLSTSVSRKLFRGNQGSDQEDAIQESFLERYKRMRSKKPPSPLITDKGNHSENVTRPDQSPQETDPMLLDNNKSNTIPLQQTEPVKQTQDEEFNKASSHNLPKQEAIQQQFGDKHSIISSSAINQSSENEPTSHLFPGTQIAQTPGKSSIKFAETGTSSIKFAETSTSSIKFAETSTSSIKFAETSTSSIKFAETGTSSIKFAETGKPSIKFAETGKPAIKFAETGKPSIKFSETGKFTIKFPSETTISHTIPSPFKILQSARASSMTRPVVSQTSESRIEVEADPAKPETSEPNYSSQVGEDNASIKSVIQEESGDSVMDVETAQKSSNVVTFSMEGVFAESQEESPLLAEEDSGGLVITEILEDTDDSSSRVAGSTKTEEDENSCESVVEIKPEGNEGSNDSEAVVCLSSEDENESDNIDEEKEDSSLGAAIYEEEDGDFDYEIFGLARNSDQGQVQFDSDDNSNSVSKEDDDQPEETEEAETSAKKSTEKPVKEDVDVKEKDKKGEVSRRKQAEERKEDSDSDVVLVESDSDDAPEEEEPSDEDSYPILSDDEINVDNDEDENEDEEDEEEEEEEEDEEIDDDAFAIIHQFVRSSSTISVAPKYETKTKAEKPVDSKDESSLVKEDAVTIVSESAPEIPIEIGETTTETTSTFKEPDCQASTSSSKCQKEITTLHDLDNISSKSYIKDDTQMPLVEAPSDSSVLKSAEALNVEVKKDLETSKYNLELKTSCQNKFQEEARVMETGDLSQTESSSSEEVEYIVERTNVSAVVGVDEEKVVQHLTYSAESGESPEGVNEKQGEPVLVSSEEQQIPGENAASISITEVLLSETHQGSCELISVSQDRESAMQIEPNSENRTNFEPTKEVEKVIFVDTEEQLSSSVNIPLIETTSKEKLNVLPSNAEEDIVTEGSADMPILTEESEVGSSASEPIEMPILTEEASTTPHSEIAGEECKSAIKDKVKSSQIQTPEQMTVIPSEKDGDSQQHIGTQRNETSSVTNESSLQVSDDKSKCIKTYAKTKSPVKTEESENVADCVTHQTSVPPEEAEAVPVTIVNQSVSNTTNVSKHSIVSSPKAPTENKIFYFGRDEENETHLITTQKANFQVGNHASLSDEDEPVDPMEVAMIEEAEEEEGMEEKSVVVEEEETDPRNTCMLDLSLHLSDEDMEKREKPEKPLMVDKSMITVDSYLQRKSRRARKSSTSSATSDTGYKTLPELVPVSSTKTSTVSEKKIENSVKQSFGTQTQETCLTNDIEDRSRSSTISQRGERELKGILKRPSMVTTQESKDSEQEKGHKKRESKVSEETLEEYTRDTPRRSRRSSVSSQGREVPVNVRASDPSEEKAAVKKESSKPPLFGILKNKEEKTLLKRPSQSPEDETVSSEKQRRKSRASTGESSRSKRYSAEPELRGILKNTSHRRRSSVTSDSAGDLRKKLEEDFPEERKPSRRYSVEPELLATSKRIELLEKSTKRSLNYEPDPQDDNSSTQQREDHRSRRRSSVSNTSDTLDRMSRGGSEEPQLRGILKKSIYRKSRRSSCTSESADDLRRRLEEDFPEVKNRRRESESKEESTSRSRRHSHVSEISRASLTEEENSRRRERYSEEPELRGILKNKSGRSRKSTSDVDVAKEPRLHDDQYETRHKRYSVDSREYAEKNEDRRRSRRSSVSRTTEDEDSIKKSHCRSDTERSHRRTETEMEYKTSEQSNRNESDERERPDSRLSYASSSQAELHSSDDMERGGSRTPEKRKRKSLPRGLSHLPQDPSVKTKKSLSLHDFPIRRSTRLHPVLEEIKEEEEEETPLKKKRTLDDLDALEKEMARRKEGWLSTLGCDSPASVKDAEEYAKERRLTRTQKKMLLRNVHNVLDVADSSASPASLSASSSTPRKSSRRTPVKDSPPKTPTRTSLRLQKKHPTPD